MVTGGSCGARPPSCSVVRVAPARRCGFAGAGPAAVALTVSPFLLRVGAPPLGLGGRRAAPVAPQLRWVPGGGGGRPPRPLSGLCGRGGGGSGGGPLVPWRCLSSAGGGGAAWQSWPRGLVVFVINQKKNQIKKKLRGLVVFVINEKKKKKPLESWSSL